MRSQLGPAIPSAHKVTVSFFPKTVKYYLLMEQHYPPMEPTLSSLIKLEHSSLSRGIPIIGREKGHWLLQQVKQLQPKRILELGTANGYSGCILGSGGAQLITVEIDERMAQEAVNNFAEFNVRAQVIVGDGVKIIKDLVNNLVNNKQYFDLIFIDFAKNKYIAALDYCLKLILPGGVIIADNISMGGCKDFKEAVLNHPKLKTEIIPIKDGLSYSKLI